MTDPAIVRKYAERIGTDPFFFVEQLWKDRRLDRFWPLTDLEYDFVHYTFGLGPKAKRRRIVLAWRNFGKTLLLSTCLCLYRARRDRERKFLINSKSELHAKKTVGVIREFLGVVPFLRDLEPQDGDLDSALAFNFAGVEPHRQPSLSAFGIGGQLEGNHVHTLIGDDIETKANSKTLTARLELRRLASEFTNILEPYIDPARGGPVDPPEVVVVGTPKHEETIYLDMAKVNPETGRRLYSIRGYPIRVPLEGENTIALAPYVKKRVAAGTLKPGDPLMPSRFPQSEIEDRESEGRHEFRREQMLAADLGDSGRYPLQLRDLMVMRLDRDRAPVAVTRGFIDRGQSTRIDDIPSLGLNDDGWFRPIFVDSVLAPYQRTIVAIDPAGRGEDKIAATCMSVLNGLFFLKGLVAFKGGCSPENLEQLALFAREHNARHIYFEPNADTLGLFSSALEPVLRRHFTLPGDDRGHPDGWQAVIEDSRHLRAHGGGESSFKEARIIDTIHVPASTGRLIVSPAVAANAEFQRQYTRIRKERNCLGHEDEIDSVALAIRALQHEVRVDTVKAAGQHMEQEIDRIIEQAEADFFGRPAKVHTWLT